MSVTYSPTGTLGSPTTSLTPGLFRSASVLMPSGFPGATAISSLFLQNATGVWTRFLAVSCAIVSVFAVAITSAGAPLSICVTSACDPAYEYVALKPGWSNSSPCSAVLNADVSDDAASTVIDPLNGSGEALVPADPELAPPHAASASAAVAPTTIIRGPVRVVTCSSFVHRLTVAAARSPHWLLSRRRRRAFPAQGPIPRPPRG